MPPIEELEADPIWSWNPLKKGVPQGGPQSPWMAMLTKSILVKGSKPREMKVTERTEINFQPLPWLVQSHEENYEEWATGGALHPLVTFDSPNVKYFPPVEVNTYNDVETN